MSDHRSEKIEELFDQALALPEDQRSYFLDQNCDDPKLRREVEKLLSCDGRDGGGLTGNVVDRIVSTEDGPQSHDPGVTAPRLDSSSNSAIDHGRFLPGTVLSNRYRIVGMLGKGGMGEVYRADDLDIGQSVALKFLPAGFSDDRRLLERFRSEVRLARQVSHPNVCRVYDIAHIDDTWFLSMEYVDGEDLSQLLKRIGHFNSDRAVELARQLCLGLHAAHEQGVLHRDLKPANVMIDGRGKLLITDFGLAEFADNVRSEDIRSGTPAYMAPEQLTGREVTAKSDIYSLGMILHELFTGKPAFEAETMAELLEQRQAGSTTSSSNADSNLDPIIEQVIGRCLEPDPANRPDSAMQVLASLPGGDPLAAAMVAGETPSPEMVAAAGDSIRFNTRMAYVSLLAITIGLLLTILLEDTTSPVASSNLDCQPPTLREKVRRMISNKDSFGEESKNSFGYELGNIEIADGFRWFPNTTKDPEKILYWYRQRKKDEYNKDNSTLNAGFRHYSFWSSSWGKYSWVRPDFFVPAEVIPGEIQVILSGIGEKNVRLQFFRACPEQQIFLKQDEEEKSPLSDSNPNRWSTWFPASLTGVDLSENGEPESESLKRPRRVEKNWTPLDPVDDLAYWEGDGYRVFAASWRGKPSFYRILYDDDEEEKDEENSSLNGSTTEDESTIEDDQATKEIPSLFKASRTREQTDYLILVIIAAMVSGIAMAWRNLLTDRVDWRGGRRLAIYVAAINFVILFSFARFTLNPQDLYAGIISFGFAIVLFEVARIWVWYMALEPFVRKVWPQILITSSRLLEGRLLDPLVGRDLLAGMLGGILMIIVLKINVLIHHAMGHEINLPAIFLALPVEGPKEFVGTLFAAHGQAFFYAVCILMIVLMCRILLRTEKRSLVGAIIILTPLIQTVIGGEWYITIFVAIITSAFVLFLLVRFGILALLVYYSCRAFLSAIPLTFDSSIWYFQSGLAVASLVMLAAIFGFYLATRQPSGGKLVAYR